VPEVSSEVEKAKSLSPATGLSIASCPSLNPNLVTPVLFIQPLPVAFSVQELYADVDILPKSIRVAPSVGLSTAPQLSKSFAVKELVVACEVSPTTFTQSSPSLSSFIRLTSYK